MSIVAVAQGINFSGASVGSIATSTTLSVAAGERVKVWVYYFAAAVTVTVSDGTNNFNPLPAFASVNDGNSRLYCFERYYATGATVTITASFSGNVPFAGIVAARCDGGASGAIVASACAGNVQTAPTTAANAVTSGNLTPPAAASTIYALTLNDTAGATPAAGGGFVDGGAYLSNPPNVARLESFVTSNTTPLPATFTAGVNATHLTIAVAVANATAGVTVSSTSTLREGEAATITGTGFGASQGAGSVTIGGVAQAVTGWADTSITITVARGTNRHGVNLTLTVTNNAAQSGNLTVQHLPQTGWNFVNLVAPLAAAGDRITAIADLAGGDQLAYEALGGDVNVSADGTFDVDELVTEFDVQAWDLAVPGWGTVGTQTISDSYIGSGAINLPSVSVSGSGTVVSGPASVTLVGPLATQGFRLHTMPDLAPGYVVEYEITGGSGTLTVNPDGSFVASAGVIRFRYRVNDGGGFGAWITDEVQPQRVRPTPILRMPPLSVSGTGTVS